MGAFLQPTHQSRLLGEDYKVNLHKPKYTRDFNIGIPFKFHRNTTMINFARDGSRGVEVDERIALFFREWISSFDVGELGGRELSEASLWLKLLFFDNFCFIF